jgi:Ssp1 endopeptidase immunity protein Rap1a
MGRGIKQMIRWSLYLAFLVAFGSTAQGGPSATTHTFSAEFYLTGCKDFIGGRSNFFSGRCVGAIEVLDALNSDTKVFCPPAAADNQLRVRTVVSYIEAHPQRIQEDFRLLANEAMAKAWPCK